MKVLAQRKYDLIPVNKLINAEIKDVIYEIDHAFPVYEKKDGKITDQVRKRNAVQFIFVLEGVKSPPPSKWIPISNHENSYLYKMFFEPLVEGAYPGMEIELDLFKGFKIKMMWATKIGIHGGFLQSPQLIVPFGEKLKFIS